jgi:hypothetical protein
MERTVAMAVNRLADDNFGLFGPADRPTFFDLLKDYFCGADPEEIDYWYTASSHFNKLGLHFSQVIKKAEMHAYVAQAIQDASSTNWPSPKECVWR